MSCLRMGTVLMKQYCQKTCTHAHSTQRPQMSGAKAISFRTSMTLSPVIKSNFQEDSEMTICSQLCHARLSQLPKAGKHALKKSKHKQNHYYGFKKLSHANHKCTLLY